MHPRSSHGSASPVSPGAGWRLFVARWGPFFVPLLYLLLVLWLQPADRLGDSETAPWLGRLVYDDYDPAARVLRGLNAELGRTAGRPDESDWLDDREYCAQLDAAPALDADERLYFLEYPHAALWLFRMGYAFGNRLDDVDVPAGVSDGNFHNLVDHMPRNQAELRLWRHFRRAIQIYAIFATLCLLALMVVLKQGYEPGAGVTGQLFLLVLPATLYFTLHRFDVVPALLTALSLACLGRRWLVAAAVFLGAATMVKVYPLLLAPLVIRYLSDNRRDMLAWIVAYGITMVVLLLPPIWLSGWSATWAPYRYQLSRSPEGWTLYGYVLPRGLDEDNWVGRLFRAGSVLLAVSLLSWRRAENLAGLLRRAAMVLIVFVALQVFYSPQWILWFSPLLVPLSCIHRRVGQLTVALDLVTFLTFPCAYDLPESQAEQVIGALLIFARMQSFLPFVHAVGAQRVIQALLIFARFAVLALLVAVLWRAEYNGRRGGQRPEGPLPKAPPRRPQACRASALR